jgi:hypothetical protein
MNKPTKTLKQIRYADGRTEIIRKVAGGYSWDGGNAISSHLSNIEFSLEGTGAIIETIPNLDYDRQLNIYNRQPKRDNSPLARLFGSR